MTISGLRWALSIYAAAAMLAGCGGSPALIGNPDTSGIEKVFSHHRTFHYTGNEQTFKVPASVKLITVDARGAGGGIVSSDGQIGRGGRVSAELPVVPGESLAIFVGGAAAGATGGYNGGGEGNPGSGSYFSSGGGGASDIREGGTALKARILVAGGGGGEAEGGIEGGQGGGRIAGAGANGQNFEGYGSCEDPAGGGGGGGSQQSGGTAGQANCQARNGTAGVLGVGGRGGDGNGGYGGAGGGGGYYGGGGGAGGNYVISQPWIGTGGGGGGGSSYVERSAQKHKSWRGWKGAAGNGEIVVRW
jgi:hypothetical protein